MSLRILYNTVAKKLTASRILLDWLFSLNLYEKKNSYIAETYQVIWIYSS